MKSSNKDNWMKACDSELKSLEEKKVYSLVNRPDNRHVIGGKWVFKIKLGTSGEILKYKARYVAKGYTQEEGVDYKETFSPTGRPTSLRTIIAIASNYGWEVHQMDAVCAFLNSKLDEEIYMEQPEGYKKDGDKVCLLHKSLYGLKQSGRNWNKEVSQFLQSMDFVKTKEDECVYTRRKEEKITIIYVHVDNLAITGNYINEIKEQIQNRWKMEDLGIAHKIVGIQIERISTHSYCINQTQMIQELLNKHNIKENERAQTPFPQNSKLTKATAEEAETFRLKALPFRSVVMSIMYVALCTRPDICFATCALSRFLENPKQDHWDHLVHLLKYLNSTKTISIVYEQCGNMDCEGDQSWSIPDFYSDSDWAGDKITRRSTTGYVFMFMNGAISWRSRLQQTVALSSTEAEYRATTEAGQEVIWITGLLQSLGIKLKLPVTLRCDNLSTIHLSSRSIFHSRTKHIELHHHWIREQVEKGAIKLKHIPTNEMLADLLTKTLGKKMFIEFRSLIGLKGI